MYYNTNVGPDVANAERYLAVHLSHPGTKNWKVLGRLIKSNYATYKDTRNSVSGIVNIIGGTLLMCSTKTQRDVMSSST